MKTRKKKGMWLSACLCAVVIILLPSCQSSDTKEASVPKETRDFMSSFGENLNIMMTADLSPVPSRRHVDFVYGDARPDSQRVGLRFPTDVYDGEIEGLDSISTVEQLLKLCHRTAAEIFVDDTTMTEYAITLSNKAASESLRPIVSSSRKFLRERDFTDEEIDEMISEEGGTEEDLAVLVSIIATYEYEMERHSVAQAAPQVKFNLMDLFATPARAQLMPPPSDPGFGQTTYQVVVRDVLDCAYDVVIGVDFKKLLASTGPVVSKTAVKAAFKSIAKKTLGAVGAVIAVAQFACCMKDKGYW